MRHPRSLALLFLPLVVLGCDAGPDDEPVPIDRAAAESAAEAIEAEELMTHVARLSSDAFGGRAPATPGEDSTVAYLTEQFRARGLQPGNPDGSWTQPLTLVGIRSEAEGSIQVDGRDIGLSYPDEFVAVSYRDGASVSVDGSEVVFVGYGVDAPEYEWDDYAGQDMSGKTLIMLVNDPPVRVEGDTAALDPHMFNGEAMTYYGRWTYKYDIGAEKGADAVIIVHETGPAGYPWGVVSGSWGGENFDIVSEGGGEPLKVEGWITREKAEELFAAAGHDFEELKAAARHRGFEPVPLGATADFAIDMTRRTVESRNVAAKVEGDTHPDEYIVYTAHWDHLGTDPSLTEDSIYNGAMDNATGTGGLLEVAEAFKALPEPPARSILFLAVTAEEQGLLGARYYAENPLYPLDRTLANINLDGLNIWGPTEDVVVVGYGSSSLEEVLRTYAGQQGRTLTPDPESEKGYYYRSDHFEFAKKGVPALYVDAGTRYRDRPEGWGEARMAQWTEEDYHQPSDEITDEWDLAGAVEDLRLLFLVGYDVAESETWPTWNEGNEFRATRQEMLGTR
ncbi:MAG: M28 family metallopeptidase [Longimicrobiales bacterium]|nr:M28 family metallopeptidase [Longimicrobiales bacterium]